MPSDPVAVILLYFLLPLWLLAGVADWLCHRAARIERSTGAKESLIHLLMLGEVGVPLLGALFLEINALVILVAIAAFLVHEATAMWDVRYASSLRWVGPVEQHVHSFLEMIPLMALLIIAALHWDQFLALFGASGEAPRFDLRWKAEPLPASYVVPLLAAVAGLALLPYLEELLRGLRAARGKAAGRRVFGLR